MEVSGGDTAEDMDAVKTRWKPTFDPDFNNLVPQPNVKPATKAETDDVTVTPTTLVFSKAAHADVLLWKPGRLVVAAPGEGAGKNPLGFARRVVSVAEKGPDIVVTTEIPALEELFSGDMQMTLDPDKAKFVDLSKLDLEWAAKNLYIDADVLGPQLEGLTDSYPLEAGDVDEDGNSLPPALPGDPWWPADQIVSAAKSIGQFAAEAAEAAKKLAEKLASATVGGSVSVNKELTIPFKSELFSFDSKRSYKVAGKLPIDLAAKGTGTIQASLGFNPAVQFGMKVPVLGPFSNASTSVWANFDSYARASIDLDVLINATIASAGGESGAKLAETLKNVPKTAEDVLNQTKDFFSGDPNLKPGASWRKPIFLSKPFTQTIVVGIIPVAFTETLQVDLECGFEAKFSFTAKLKAESSLSFKFNARYEQGELTKTDPTVDFKKTFDVKVLAGGTIVATCGLIPRVNVLVYDSLGINVGVRASLIAKGSYQSSCSDNATDSQPKGEVKVDLSADFGLQVGARAQVPLSSFFGTEGLAAGFTVGPAELYHKEFPIYGNTWNVPGVGYCTPTCTNSKKDALETDADCGGGACSSCETGQGCLKNNDCKQGFCATGKCSLTDHCSDGVRDGDETAIDCGGALCGKCALKRGCMAPTDCRSGFCKILPQLGAVAGFCVADHCQDNVKNSGEAGIDCGGDCKACALGVACNSSAQCESGFCNGFSCDSYSTCMEIKQANPNAPDGKYTIRPGEKSFDVYCDMTQNGGGWTLVFNEGPGWNMMTGQDVTVPDGSDPTGYMSHATTDAYGLLTFSDIMLDASDSEIAGNDKEVRTVIIGVHPVTQDCTLALAMNGGCGGPLGAFLELEDNSNLTNTFTNGDCSTLGKWGAFPGNDYNGGICGTNVLTFGDGTLGFGTSASFSMSAPNGAGWPQNPDCAGSNCWPDYFRIWIR